MRYKGAISDADVLINLAKVNRLDILDYLFGRVIIPQYVFDYEIKLKAGKCYSVIGQAINKKRGVFAIVDRRQDAALNYLAREIIEEKKKLIGPGESECAGYAQAMRIPIIISELIGIF